MTNQAPPLVDYDVFTADRALHEAVLRYDGEDSVKGLASLGSLAGSARAQRWGVEANAHPPQLRTHDRYGNRVDEVEFHPAWHELLRVAVGEGLHAAPWAPDAGPAARRRWAAVPASGAQGAACSPSPTATRSSSCHAGWNSTSSTRLP